MYYNKYEILPNLNSIIYLLSHKTPKSVNLIATSILIRIPFTSIYISIYTFTLVRLIMTGNIVAGKNMADFQKICMPYKLSQLQKLIWRVLLWQVEMKI